MLTIKELMEKFKEAQKENNIQLMAEIDEKLKALTKIDPSKRPSGDDGDKNNPEPKWKSFGELLQAVAKAETKHELDPRLVYEKQLGMNEGVGADGGYNKDAHIKSCYMLETPKIFITPMGVTI